jgi:AcrR family transcriptional regulator
LASAENLLNIVQKASTTSLNNVQDYHEAEIDPCKAGEPVSYGKMTRNAPGAEGAARAPMKKNSVERKMPKSQAASAGDLSARLIAAAARCVEDYGVAGVKARNVAAHAGCSPGLIYYAYADLGDLILALNRATQHRLNEALGKALVSDPRDSLDRLAKAYLAFAYEHTRLWRALFEHHMGPGKEVPDDYRADIMATFSRLKVPLGALLPRHPEDEIEMISRALFSAVHGIVSLGLDENMVAVPLEQLEEQVCRFVTIFMNGLQYSASG